MLTHSKTLRFLGKWFAKIKYFKSRSLWTYFSFCEDEPLNCITLICLHGVEYSAIVLSQPGTHLRGFSQGDADYLNTMCLFRRTKLEYCYDVHGDAIMWTKL